MEMWQIMLYIGGAWLFYGVFMAVEYPSKKSFVMGLTIAQIWIVGAIILKSFEAIPSSCS